MPKFRLGHDALRICAGQYPRTIRNAAEYWHGGEGRKRGGTSKLVLGLAPSSVNGAQLVALLCVFDGCGPIFTMQTKYGIRLHPRERSRLYSSLAAGVNTVLLVNKAKP